MALSVTGQDLVKRFDYKLIGRLVADDETVLSKTDVESNAEVATALDDALGRFYAAVQSGARYSVDDLDSLTASSLSYAKRLICNCAILALMARRPGTHTMERESMLKETEGALGALSNGKDVFTLVDHLESGLLDPEKTTESIRIRRSLIADRLRGHLTTYEDSL